ncbi:WD40 repeat domain-containing protein [Laspinema sp. D1]|uniref:WD40 repeat domain-containing protein n=2 Tax=Laspinema TaxID=2584823 RepID=A0ABT2N1K8_9CYAN|nr:WD40 repeat domain-containing protein [Laspinema sp. D2a]
MRGKRRNRRSHRSCSPRAQFPGDLGDRADNPNRMDPQERSATALRSLTIEERHSMIVSSLGYSPDGITLASGSHDGTIKLWQNSSG